MKMNISSEAASEEAGVWRKRVVKMHSVLRMKCINNK
jgi:hypothetical protein